jgi:hypothetical protein
MWQYESSCDTKFYHLFMHYIIRPLSPRPSHIYGHIPDSKIEIVKYYWIDPSREATPLITRQLFHCKRCGIIRGGTTVYTLLLAHEISCEKYIYHLFLTLHYEKPTWDLMRKIHLSFISYLTLWETNMRFHVKNTFIIYFLPYIMRNQHEISCEKYIYHLFLTLHYEKPTWDLMWKIHLSFISYLTLWKPTWDLMWNIHLSFISYLTLWETNMSSHVKNTFIIYFLPYIMRNQHEISCEKYIYHLFLTLHYEKPTWDLMWNIHLSFISYLTLWETNMRSHVKYTFIFYILPYIMRNQHMSGIHFFWYQ